MLIEQGHKRGQVYSLILVFVVMAMMGMVVGIMGSHQKQIHASVVSSIDVLEIRDNLERFEINEKSLITGSLSSIRAEFGTDEFHNSFRENFIGNIYRDNFMRNFLFSNLTIGGVRIEDIDKDLSLIENRIYPKSQSGFGSEGFIFSRVEIGKKYLMKSDNENNIGFPVRFGFEFDRKYLINKVGSDYVVEVVE